MIVVQLTLHDSWSRDVHAERFVVFNAMSGRRRTIYGPYIRGKENRIGTNHF